jgi:hypothetical protein
MDRVLECEHFKPREISLIKYCRLFLQVHTIADLATAGGTHVDLVSSKVDRVTSLVRQEIWKYTKNVQVLRKRGLLGERHALSGAMFVRAPYMGL